MNNMNVYRVSSGPHVRSRNTAGDVMYDVILALVPGAQRFAALAHAAP